MAKIFISYRRADSQQVSGRIYDRLSAAFGERNIFKDVDDIPPGMDFRGVLREATANCDVMLVVIGPQWLDVRDSDGQRRLDDPEDFVRFEVEAGLQIESTRVIPLLVDGAAPPAANALPASLQPLAYANAFTLHNDPIFNRDMETLIRHLRELIKPRRRFDWRWVIGLMVLLAIAAAFILLRLGDDFQPDTTQTPTRARIVTTATEQISASPAVTLTSLPRPTDGSVPTNTEVVQVTETKTATLSPSEVLVSSNNQWTPLEREFAGVEMVLVPPGCFMLGSRLGDPDEQPVHNVCFDRPFWIDRYEVTQADFVRLGGSQNGSPHFPDENRPVESISWSEARDFCELRGSRLPTEAEWEYAASGPDNLVYPWGNEYVSNNVVNREDAEMETAPVGSRPEGVSWVGAFDLSGNVWEWVHTIYDESRFPYPYATDDGREDGNIDNTFRVLRGGSWGSDQWFVRAFVRVRPDAGERFFDWGFRCVRDFIEGDLS